MLRPRSSPAFFNESLVLQNDITYPLLFRLSDRRAIFSEPCTVKPTPRCSKPAFGFLRAFDKRGELGEGHPPPSLVIGDRQARWKSLVYADNLGAAVCIPQRDRDRHFAAQHRIRRFELVHFDDLLVRHEL